MGDLELSDGARLHYDESGDGPAVILLHPGLWDGRTWDPQMESFPAAGFRTIRYDARGYGASSRLTGAPYSNVRDLRELVDALDVAQGALVGCSMGGANAIDFTLTHPDRVWALVPVAAGLAGVELVEEDEDDWAALEQAIQAAIDAGDVERAQELRLGIWASLGLDDEAGSAIRRIAFDNLHEVTMDESAAEQLDPPAAHRLGEIDVPTLVLEAEHDPPDARRVSDVIARGILGARKVVVDADHVVNLRNPAAFDEAVIPFLRDAAP